MTAEYANERQRRIERALRRPEECVEVVGLHHYAFGRLAGRMAGRRFGTPWLLKRGGSRVKEFATLAAAQRYAEDAFEVAEFAFVAPGWYVAI